MNEVKVAEIEVGKMQDRTHRACDESTPPFEQNARHDDLEKIERREITIDAAGDIHQPCDQDEVYRNLSIRLPNVGFIQLQQSVPAGRKRINDGKQDQQVDRR